MALGCQKRAVCPRTVPPASGRTGEAGPGSVNVDGFSERDDSHSEWLPLAVTLFPKWAYAKGDRSPAVRSSHAKPLRGDASEDHRLGPTVPPDPTVATLSRGGRDMLKSMPC
jgi:hypothetical protein